MPIHVIPPKKQLLPKGSPARNQTLRVAAYCRVSTDLDDQESSYEAQIAHYTDVIDQHKGWSLAGIYADQGLSGTSTARREEFNRMIHACEEGQIDMVMTKSISRFARNTLDCLNYIRKLKALEIPILFEKENIDTMGSSGELLITIMASIAQQESQSISQNVRMGIQYGFQQGRPRLNDTRFLGYGKHPKTGKLVIVPEEAVTVRRIFRDFLEGMTPGEIVHALELEGIPSPCGKPDWPYSTVLSMLRNEKYMGDLLLQKTVTVDFQTGKKVRNDGQVPQYYIENAHNPIIPREVFTRVQGELLRREQQRKATGKRSVKALDMSLNGKICCGHCGQPYRRVAGKPGTDLPTVWRCRGRRRDPAISCTGRPLKEETVKAAVVAAFNLVPERRENLIRLQERIRWGPLDRLAQEIEDLRTRQRELEMTLNCYYETHMLDERTLVLCSRNRDPEEAVATLLQDLEDVQRQIQLKLSQHGDLAVQELQIASLLKLCDQITGRTVAEPEAERKRKPSRSDLTAQASCRSMEDFYARTDRIRQEGPVEAFSDALVFRYLDGISVEDRQLRVRFKAGIEIPLDS